MDLYILYVVPFKIGREGGFSLGIEEGKQVLPTGSTGGKIGKA